MSRRWQSFLNAGKIGMMSYRLFAQFLSTYTLSTQSRNILISSFLRNSYCPVSDGAITMSRTSRTYGMSIFEIAIWNFASSLVIRPVLNCTSSTRNHSVTSSTQNGGTRNKMFTESTLLHPVVVLSTLVRTFGTGHFELSSLKFW